MSGDDPIEFWAEEGGIRIKFERWGPGMKITIWELGEQRQAKTASLADFRWRRALEWFAGGHLTQSGTG